MSEKNTGPVEVPAVTQQGSTFAERAKAAGKKVEPKQVDADEVEDKAIAAKKTSAKRKS